MKRKKKRTNRKRVRITAALIFLAVYMAALVWVHGHLCRVDGGSMEPSYKNGDIVYTKTFSDDTAPAFGDVVVLDEPAGENASIPFLPWRAYLTKRVVGLPGDFLEGREDGLYRNGEFLEEPYVASWEQKEYFAVELGEGEYFVLGDNRDGSYDSRSFGPVPERSIKRKILKIIFGSGDARTIDGT